MKIIYNKKFQVFLLVLIILVGFLFRIYKFYKVQGLWTDEMWSYHVASRSSLLGILQELYNNNIHSPLWFFLLHFWMKIFGENDLILRFFSVIWGTLTIPIIYLAGKELSSKKVGFLAATLTSINSFLIYYSQEVRFYSFLVFLASLSVLFVIRIKNNSDLKNYIWLVLTNLAIIYSFPAGIIFVFWELTVFSIYLYYKYREKFRYIIYSQIAVLILTIPYMFLLIHQIKTVSNSIIPIFPYYKITFQDIFFLFQQMFSPVFVNLPNRSLMYFLLFAIIPIAISFIGIISSTLRRNFVSLLSIIAILFVFQEIVLMVNGFLTFRSRYIVLIMPILILIISRGLLIIKNKHISRPLISLFIALNLIFLIYAPFSAPKLARDDQYKIIADILQKYPLSSQDTLIMVFNGSLLDKYYAKINLLRLDIGCIQSRKNLLNRILNENQLNSITKKNAYDNLKPYIASSEVPCKFKNYLKKEIDKTEENRYIVIVLSKLYLPYDSNELKNITQNYKFYKNTSLFHMLYSRINYNILKMCSESLKPVAIEIDEPWEIHILKKPAN